MHTVRHMAASSVTPVNKYVMERWERWRKEQRVHSREAELGTQWQPQVWKKAAVDWERVVGLTGWCAAARSLCKLSPLSPTHCPAS